MSEKTRPKFFHVEASSLKSDSYPIEVYWSLNEGGGTGYLVNHEGIEKWKNWDRSFLREHDFSINDVRNSGTAPSEVCQQMNQQLEGETVYSDNPANTERLLEELFSVVGGQKPQFTLRSLDELLLKELKAKGLDYRESEAVLSGLKAEARRKVHGIVGGAFEMQYFVELWELVTQY
jgi:hypothetical protein